MSKALNIFKDLSESSDEQIIKELIGEFGKESEEEIRDSFDTEGRYGRFARGKSGSFTVDGVEYNWFDNEETAEEVALEIVRNDLEEQPEIFNQSWLQDFITMSDTDKRMFASEEADSRVGDMDDEEVVRVAGMEDEYEAAEEVEDKDQVIENARNAVREKISDEVEDELDDPVQYFVHDQGLYSIKDLMKQSWISIDAEEAADSALKEDGWAHFLSLYNGDYEETKGGVIYFRES
jgi:hypothetical protein